MRYGLRIELEVGGWWLKDDGVSSVLSTVYGYALRGVVSDARSRD
jgi:hypothetical protein